MSDRKLYPPAGLSEEPKYVLAAPGSVTTPRHRFTKLLAAGSLLAVAFRPNAGLWQQAAANAPATNYLVINNLDTGPGSLRQAVIDANTHPGFDTISFAPQVSGTIHLTSGQLLISTTVSVQGPGPGKLALSGGNTQRIFYLYSTANTPFTATISGLTLRDGKATGSTLVGGALAAWDANLTLDNVDIISNSATLAGGGLALDGGRLANGLTLRNSLISGNQSGGVEGRGGGIFLYQGTDGLLIQNTQILTNSANQYGGGIAFYFTKGTMLVEDSTIAGNSASYGGGLWGKGGDTHGKIIRRSTISGNNAYSGGGILLHNTNGPFLIENSTVDNNSADIFGGRGGGISIRGISGAGIQNSTIVSNSAAFGGGIDVVTTTLPVTDSIIAGNAASHNSPDITGTFQLKYDLIQVTGTATITNVGGNVFGLDPLLGPLADNGGPTQTRLPADKSPAVNAGDPAFAPPPTTDQRGQPRVRDGRIDIGAVETEIVKKLFLPLLER